ncbi:glycoside hydrolase family 88 protein [Paenibacillus sp. 2TAB23]|uniref:glycoside hydrolase family 88 protein n=1 Tax=Paenibacillus sp. 2TAB23 TaxID=3233004 RepID=UPI003F9A30C2
METSSWTTEAWGKVHEKVARTSTRIGARFPHASIEGTYVLEAPHWWTAGFWPGLLWLLYRDSESNDERYKEIAEACEQQLDDVLFGFDKLDHDIGFMWSLTSVARYKLLGDEQSRKRALLAASVLSGRFNVKGNYIRAWNPWGEGDRNEGWAIIDCMMNLPLLYFASETTNDPRFKHLAMEHADTVLEHFIRTDGSVNHIVVFHPLTGEFESVNGGQGFAPNSAWSRGAAWAIYGMALSYRYTGELKYLEAAKRVAHFFLANLPEDSIPYWDFRLPTGVERYRDSSAGACAACGLLEIARAVPSEEAGLYQAAGERILRSLYENYGAWDNEAEEGLILHGTSHYPERRNIDVPLIYGDYFFVEGLARLRGNSVTFW